ncbi:hypothetical protein [Archangium sp.]|uniref:hypothetical protein n=1 Tax=Archangium sp. TaxID=1872627 RepID=UPI003899CDD5
MGSARHPWTWLGVLAVWVSVSGTAHATETDQYFAIDKPLRDSLGVLNEKINRDVLGALELVNRGDWEHTSCQDVSQRVYQRFRIAGLHKIELWAENTPRIDRSPHHAEYEGFLRESSLYRNSRFWDWGLTFGVRPTFNVDGIHMGADKLSHFFQTGWKYHKRFRALRQAGVPEHEALEQVVRYGVGTEYGSLGLGATGVFSFGDLEANYQGFRFYRSLCEGEQPRLVKTAGGWRLQRPFDWREYLSRRLDESCNNSAFTPKRWSEVQANLRRDYCPRLDTEVFREHSQQCAHSSREPDDFNARYVRELSSLGLAPRQEDFSLWAACGRSPPESGTGIGGAEAPRSATEADLGPPPHYETPRFDEALLRPRFELGAGGFGGAGADWNGLLQTRFVLQRTVVPEDAWDAVRTPEYLLWASLDGRLALSSAALPYADLHFTAVERRFELNDVDTGDTLAVGVALAPMRFTRFTRMDRKLGVELSLAGAQVRKGTHFGERRRLGVFASVALDAVGYKAAFHLSSPDTFHGVHAASVLAETGAELLLGEPLRLGLVLGGSAGVSLGWSRGYGFSAPSDLGAWAEAQVDVTRSLRLFARGQLDALREPARGQILSAPAFSAGAALRF